MDDRQSADHYISGIELHPPSPDGTHHLDLYSSPDYNNVNSPYSAHSDLSFGDEHHLNGLFPDDLYDPADFDNPHSGQPLLMFDDPNNEYYNYYRSPSPSGSDNNEDAHSRVSSASSANTQFHSPNLSMAQSFENLSFHSPNWGTDPLPQQKPMSPPRLIMDPPQPPIIVNAPEDGSDLGPSLHIVPATPISGGSGVINIATSQVPPRPWLDVDSHSDPSSRSPSPSHSLAATTPAPSRSPSSSPQPPNQAFLYPQQPRTRSKSDTSLEPPNWDTLAGGQGFPQHHPSQQPYQGGDARPPTLGNNFTFGSAPSSSNHGNSAHESNGTTNSNGYLSPKHAEFHLSAEGGLRRSKSDAGGNGGLPRHRISRSEDIRHGAFGGMPGNNYLLPDTAQTQFLFPPNAHGPDYMRQQTHQQQQPQYLSPRMGMQDLRITPSHGHSQSLSSTTTLTHPFGNPTAGRHFRRASSGTRSERGVSAGPWDGSDVVPSNRASPYPSPNASPRGRLQPLQPDEFNFGGLGVDLLEAGNLLQVDGHHGGRPDHQQQQPPMVPVSKPNVTTGRTANASQKRRKQEATFVCPVPGCGSTFTRSFNLKGHIRSHNEEKPFQCHWPGCGKGFARQHDCKRHEQLHTNYRPFNCDGCKKQFARMDALNRHLRSEGGAECLKLQEANGGAPSLSDATVSAKSNSTSGASSPAMLAKSLSASAAYTTGLQKQEYDYVGGLGLRGVLGDGPGWGNGLSAGLSVTL